MEKQVAKTKIEKEVMDLFGTMRDATTEEQNAIDRYLDSISVDTGNGIKLRDFGLFRQSGVSDL